MQCVGIIANPHKDGAKQTLLELRQLLNEQNIQTLVEDDTANALLENEQGISAREFNGQCDAVIVLGGDGTMLNAAQRLGATDLPVAGVNIGHLGFLTSCTEEELEILVKAFVEQTFHVVPRIMLKATVIHHDKSEKTYTAVNDITLTRGQTGRLVTLDAFIDGDLLNHYRADGLIIATPTGSTAYSLSAGGPLISPIARNFVITPICPHSLSIRSLVLADSSIVELTSADGEQEDLLFTVDGDCPETIKHGSTIRVEKADRLFNVIRLADRPFFQTLRTKLHWG